MLDKRTSFDSNICMKKQIVVLFLFLMSVGLGSYCAFADEDVHTANELTMPEIFDLIRIEADYPKTFTNTCAACHSGPRPRAPFIPFDNPSEMGRWLDQARKDLIWRRVNAPDGQQMPPNRRLDRTELEEVRQYLGK